MRKRTKVAASAGAALAIAGAGAAVAADRLTPRTESQAVLDDAAKQLGVDPTKLSNALEQALKNRVDDLVEDGLLTKAEGDTLKERIDSSELPLLATPFFGPHGREIRPGLGFGPGRFFHHVRANLEAAATYLGVDEETIATALRDGKSLADLAKQQGKSVDGLVDALVAAETKELDAEVAAGRLTDAQRDRIVSRLEDRIEGLVNLKPPNLGFRFGPGAFLPSRGTHLDAAASYLGLDEAELRAALRDGKSLADVAEDEGKSVDGLVDALVADEKKELAEAVEDGRLTDAQRDRIESTLEERITDFVNGVRPEFGFGHRLHPGFGPGPLPFPSPHERPADA